MLARIALRMAAVEALKGRTLFGDRVLDSPNGAIDVQGDGTLRTGEDKPFISVYTDAFEAGAVTGRSLIETGACTVVFEFGISAAMLEHDQTTGVKTMVGVQIPAADSAYEFALDVVQRQIADALSDPDDAWADIYRGLHHSVSSVEHAGARNTSEGQRLAGHQLRLRVMLIDDPVRGEALPSEAPFERFLAALEASGEATLQAQAATMRGIVAGSGPDWETLQRRHALTDDELRALGRGALAEDAGTFATGLVASEGRETQEVSQ